MFRGERWRLRERKRECVLSHDEKGILRVRDCKQTEVFSGEVFEKKYVTWREMSNADEVFSCRHKDARW